MTATADKPEPAKSPFRETSPEILAATDRLLAVIRDQHPETVAEPRALALAAAHVVIQRTIELHKIPDIESVQILAKATAAALLSAGISSPNKLAVTMILFNHMVRENHRELIAAVAWETVFGVFRK